MTRQNLNLILQKKLRSIENYKQLTNNFEIMHFI